MLILRYCVPTIHIRYLQYLYFRKESLEPRAKMQRINLEKYRLELQGRLQCSFIYIYFYLSILYVKPHYTESP